jgi:hypothetical protein
LRRARTRWAGGNGKLSRTRYCISSIRAPFMRRSIPDCDYVGWLRQANPTTTSFTTRPQNPVTQLALQNLRTQLGPVISHSFGQMHVSEAAQNLPSLVSAAPRPPLPSPARRELKGPMPLFHPTWVICRPLSGGLPD